MPDERMYSQRDPIELADGNPMLYGFVWDSTKQSELRNIHDIKEMEDIYVPTVKIFELFVKFALEGDDLLVAVYKSQHPKNTNVWLPHLLCEYYGELYRINLQFYECNTCGNIYDVGNVATLGLYYNIAMSEYIDVMNFYI